MKPYITLDTKIDDGRSEGIIAVPHHLPYQEIPSKEIKRNLRTLNEAIINSIKLAEKPVTWKVKRPVRTCRATGYIARVAFKYHISEFNGIPSDARILRASYRDQDGYTKGDVLIVRGEHKERIAQQIEDMYKQTWTTDSTLSNPELKLMREFDPDKTRVRDTDSYLTMHLRRLSIEQYEGMRR